MHRCYHWPCSCGKTSHGRCVGHGGNHPHGAAHTSKDVSECVTFQIVPFLESQVTNDTQLMGAVWDSYPPEDNLKAHVKQHRGNGPRTRVGDGSTQPIPKSEWNSGFLKNEDNKKELFSFISRQIYKSDVNGTLLLISTSTLCSPTGLLAYLDFNHATRLRRTPGYSCIRLMQQCKITIRHNVRTVDSDIVFFSLRLLVPERSIATFQFTHFTQVLVRQSTSH